MLADATGIETRRTGASEVTAKGAAIAGLIATSRASPEDALTKWRDDNGHWRPDPQRAALYSHQYQEFCRLKELAREGWAGHPADQILPKSCNDERWSYAGHLDWN